MKANADLLRGALEPVILEVIADGATYGYEIAKAIEKASEGRLLAQEGTLYPALHRLQKQGLLDAEWAVSPEGRQRKHYQLTPLGRKQRQALRKEWTEFTRAVNLILGIEHVQPQLAW
ncbi:MAG: helix-turn-helix transcriptional regulator [Planctomycetaceae bacterium]|nr:helix-turn-helix transcriptional regulator [Planctomycetaceae bacterium]